MMYYTSIDVLYIDRTQGSYLFIAKLFLLAFTPKCPDLDLTRTNNCMYLPSQPNTELSQCQATPYTTSVTMYILYLGYLDRYFEIFGADRVLAEYIILNILFYEKPCLMATNPASSVSAIANE